MSYNNDEGSTNPRGEVIMTWNPSTGEVEAVSSTNPFPVTTNPSGLTEAPDTRIPTSTTSATLLAANEDRTEAVIYNDASSTLLVRLSSSAASATDFTYKILSGSTLIEDKHTGAITGVLESGTGNAQVTEVS